MKRRKYGNRERRDAALFVARRYARFENLQPDLRTSLVASYVKRAEKFFPLTQRQVNGLVTLCGGSFVEKLGYTF